jgi:hypothetical protein
MQRIKESRQHTKLQLCFLIWWRLNFSWELM